MTALFPTSPATPVFAVEAPDEACRIAAPREMAALLRRLCAQGLPLGLRHRDGGGEVVATLRAVDTERNRLHFDVAAFDTALPALLEAHHAVVTGRLDDVEIRFEIDAPMRVNAEHASVLSCNGPRDLFRFQRRDAYRVCPPMRNSPVAQWWHDDADPLPHELRVLDVSIGGCALFQPDGTAPMQPGQTLRRVCISLAADTRLVVDLRLHHVSSLGAHAKGVRLGCEFVSADSTALRTLQRFIDATQKRDHPPPLD